MENPRVDGAYDQRKILKALYSHTLFGKSNLQVKQLSHMYTDIEKYEMVTSSVTLRSNPRFWSFFDRVFKTVTAPIFKVGQQMGN